MFPVRCRVMQGLGMTLMPSNGGSNPVVYMSGGYNLQSLPGYVGNNPAQSSSRPMNAFEMYKATAEPSQPPPPAIRPPIAPPVRRVNNPGMHIALPRGVLQQKTSAAEQQPIKQPSQTQVQTPVPVKAPPRQMSVSHVTEAAPSPPATAVIQPATTEEKKSSPTATVVGIGAAGILAALLFR